MILASDVIELRYLYNAWLSKLAFQWSTMYIQITLITREQLYQVGTQIKKAMFYITVIEYRVKLPFFTVNGNEYWE